MWLSNTLVGILQVAKESVDELRIDLAVLRAERDILKEQLLKSQILADWLRVKVNQLEAQNTALLEKAYNIKVAAPEIIRQPQIDPSFDPRNFTGFDDVGDELATKLGYPAYGDKQ